MRHMPAPKCLEQMLATVKWESPTVLQTLSAQFELLSVVPDVRYDYAVEGEQLGRGGVGRSGD